MCSKCNETEALETFAWCKGCRKTYDAARYVSQKAKRGQQIVAQRRRVKAWMDELKAAMPCTDCDRCYHPEVMEWDHIDHRKSANVANLVRSGLRQQAAREIEKCELVCANCHRMRTVRRRETNWI